MLLEGELGMESSNPISKTTSRAWMMSDGLMVGCDLHDKTLMLKSVVARMVWWRPGKCRRIVGVVRFLSSDSEALRLTPERSGWCSRLRRRGKERGSRSVIEACEMIRQSAVRLAHTHQYGMVPSRASCSRSSHDPPSCSRFRWVSNI